MQGAFVDKDSVVCVSPPSPIEATVEFIIHVVKEHGNISGGARYQYSKL